VWICEDHLVRLHTPEWPIVKKYSDGKVKENPRRGVKKNMKPYADKQWEENQKIWPRACWRMSRRLIGSGEVKETNVRSQSESESEEGDSVTSYGPEPGWSNHGQIEVGVTPTGGSNRPMLKNRRMSCD
jgi:hypothetical protein